jgi:hypothetical protein
MFNKVVFSCVMLLAIGGTAVAQDGIRQSDVDFIDKDKDGSISLAEYQDYSRAAFRYLDADGSGYLEYQESGEILDQRQFAQLDLDKDGRVSEMEFLLQADKDFKSADRNGSGKLSAS